MTKREEILSVLDAIIALAEITPEGESVILKPERFSKNEFTSAGALEIIRSLSRKYPMQFLVLPSIPSSLILPTATNLQLYSKLDFLRRLRAEFAGNQIVEQKGKNIIEFVVNKNKGTLKINGYSPLPFQDFRCQLINFFYNSAERKNWKTYDDIKIDLPDHNTETIRKAIEKINKRVEKHTGGKFKQIIDPGKDQDAPKAPKKYRWSC